MANLYGYLTGDHGASQTKASSRSIQSKVQTWNGSVRVMLEKDGEYTVSVGPGPSGGPSNREIAHGNLHSGEGQSRTRRAPRRATRSRSGIGSILAPRRHRRHW